MCKCDTIFLIMPSQRKRIGFLPSEEVHEIIEKLCRDNEFSQSKITGLLVEEALRSRGVLRDSFQINDLDFINYSFEKKSHINIRSVTLLLLKNIVISFHNFLKIFKLNKFMHHFDIF